MSARRVLVGSAAALLMPASLLLTVPAGTASDSADSTSDRTFARSKAKVRKKGQRIKIVALPQIVDQGRGTKSADSAKAGIVATIKPKRVGRKVKLQMKKGRGWKNVGTARVNRKGEAVFGARAAKRGKGIDYRVKALRVRGLKPVTSKSVSTDAWLNPTWTDEFSGRRLGDEWSHRGTNYEPESKRNCAKGDPSAVRVRKGAVELSVKKDPKRGGRCKIKYGRNKVYKAKYRVQGHIGTQGAFAFKYGFAAARIKMHKMRGQHGGFWMQPATAEAGSFSAKYTGAEIDVIEYFGDKHPQGGLTSFIYSKNRKGKDVKTGSWIRNSRDYLKNGRDGWSKNYHVFSVEWTPNVYIFRIDGQETWRTRTGVSGQLQYPILSLLSSDYEIPEIGSEKRLPQTMKVDWVRFWAADRKSVV